MTLDIIIQALVFFGSFGLFAIGFAFLCGTIALMINKNDSPLTEFIFVLCYFGGTVLGVSIWLGVIPYIMRIFS